MERIPLKTNPDTPSLNHRILERLNIRPGELGKTALMFTYMLLMVASLGTIKIVRDAIFLDKIPTGALPEQLSFAYMITALGALIFPFYHHYVKNIQVPTLLRSTILFFMVQMIVFWWLIQQDWNWVNYALFLWGYLFGVVSGSQAWLIANFLFHPREAKRLFALIGAGGIAGSILAGLLARMAKTHRQWFQTENLLFWVFLLQAICLILLHYLPRYLSEPEPQTHRFDQEPPPAHTWRRSFRELQKSKYLLVLAGLIALMVLIVTVVDFELKVYLKSLPKNLITAKLGDLTILFGVFSLGFQLFLSGRVFKYLGVGISILFLPLVLLTGSVFLAVFPGFFFAACLRVGDASLRHSIHRAGMELLFLPVPQSIKTRAKGLFDMLLDPLAQGVAGAFLFTTVGLLGAQKNPDFMVRSLSSLACLIILAWIMLALLARREYLNVFRLALERRTMHPDIMQQAISEEAGLMTVLHRLASPEERQALYCLELLEGVPPGRWIEPVHSLLGHSSTAVRATALRLLAGIPHSIPEQDARVLLQDPDLAVRTEAIHFLCAGKASSRLAEFLNAPELRISVAAIECLRKYDGKAAHFLDGRTVERFLEMGGDQEIQARIAAASALGLMPPEAPQQKFLPSLLHDAEFEVARRAMLSAGESRRQEWVPLLLERLTHKALRPYARRSLLKFGPSIIPVLAERLNDPSQPLALRAKIPRVLSLLNVQASVDALLECAVQPESFLGHRVIKALNKLRASGKSFRFPIERVEPLILRELGYYCLHGMLLEGKGLPEEIEAVRCLKRSLRERMSIQMERVFRLLGLIYPARDMHTAHQGIISSKIRLRASAIELLDNLVSTRIKRVLIPLLEEPGCNTYRSRGKVLEGVNPEGPEESLKQLAAGPDLWLRAMAICVAGCLRWSELAEVVRFGASSSTEMIRPTAGPAMLNLEQDTGKPLLNRTSNMLTIVDKVLHLQAIDFFAQVLTEDLAYLASIAKEIEIPRGGVIYKEDDPSNAMYVVITGRVCLLKGEEEIMTVSEQEAFGTWALFDNEPRVLTARVVEDAQLLMIHQEDFLDLLADHTEITQSLFKALVQRIKRLMPG